MNRFVVAVMGLLALPLPAGASVPASGDLLARMASVNAGLQSFTARLQAHVALRSFPFLSADVDGTYYYKQPDKVKLLLSGGVPLIAQQFDRLYAHIEPPSRWRSVYDVSLLSDDGTVTAYRLVPRKQGNVRSIEATVDDRTATVTTMRWNYVNGGYAQMNDRYRRVGGYLVVVSQTGHVDEPGYVADITATIGGYAFNASLPDSIFTGS